MKATYYGPRTIEEAEEQIRVYEDRIKKRPDSADRYQGHIDEARDAIEAIKAGKSIDLEAQEWK